MSSYRKEIEYTEGDEIVPCNLTKAEVEAYAGDLAIEADFSVGSDPAELVKRMTGRIHFQDIEEWFEEKTGSIFVHAPFDFDIYLPQYTSALRDRFTIAHELGHYFLHSEQGEGPIVAYRSGSTRIEWEANWFAAALLMPRKEFSESVNLGYNIARLASQFGVSQEAAKVRKEVLSD